jgi:hypothetical protein
MSTATYLRSGRGRSVNAEIAESDGKMPLTRAIVAVAKAVGCTHAQARELLAYVGACEWHHVGKYAAECDYYDVDDVVREFATADDVHVAALAEERERAEFEALRRSRRSSVDVMLEQCEAFNAKFEAWEEVKRLAAEAGMSNSRCRAILGV